MQYFGLKLSLRNNNSNSSNNDINNSRTEHQ